MTIDYGLIVVALGNVGAVGIVGRFLLKSVERSNESLPVILKAIEAHSKAIEELYSSRNEIKEDVTELKITHKMRGCDQPIKASVDDMRVKRKEIENA